MDRVCFGCTAMLESPATARAKGQRGNGYVAMVIACKRTIAHAYFKLGARCGYLKYAYLKYTGSCPNTYSDGLLMQEIRSSTIIGCNGPLQ